MTVTDPAVAASRRPSRHESFLVYARFRYLKIACAAASVSLLLYLVDSPYGSRYGGSWAGYTLGTAGALLILWLMWCKRPVLAVIRGRSRGFGNGRPRASVRRCG